MNSVRIKKASENCLKNVSLEIPHNKLIIVTGVSGSGKSSLIYDVIASEGMRLFYDHFIPSGRNLQIKSKKSNVESISGLLPVVVVNQNSVVRTNRSTVGTLTEIYDYLRLLFARKSNTELDNINLKKSLFSFNSATGQCPDCKGLGVLDKIEPKLIVGDETKSLREGALLLTTPNNYIVYSQVTMGELQKVCEAEGFSVDIPWKDLTPEQQNVIWYGSKKVKVLFGKHTLESRLTWSGITAKPREEGYYKGIIPVMEEILKRDRNPNVLRFAVSVPCHYCGGSRLNSTALSCIWKDRNIYDFSCLTIEELHAFFSNTNGFDKAEIEVAQAITNRTSTLIDLGCGHLELRRESPSLSGGESQRIKLANQASVSLRNILYILDEPGSGLHPSEQKKLLSVLRKLVNNGNTVIMTGHDESIIPEVDHIIDIGPGPANSGGEIIFNGSVSSFISNNPERSVTLKYLKKENVPSLNSREFTPDIQIERANLNNLKDIDVGLCSAAFNVITGVSGAGKSSLVKHFIKELNENPEQFKTQFSKVIYIDQTAIGRSPKSNPATYTGLSNQIRDLMASLPESKSLGLTKSHFSFVVKGGRCEECAGAGYIQVGMHFLGNIEIKCEKCDGKRFTDHTLQAEYNGKNIYEILELTVDEAHEHFSEIKKITKYTKWLKDLGLAYIKLGQSSTTLSGGEAQRIKLSTELVKSGGKNCLYILDEPATGLHASDTEMLISALKNLCNNGHTILCTSHEPRFILNSDYIVDLGPGSGKAGGELLVNTSTSEFVGNSETETAKALKSFIKGFPDKDIQAGSISHLEIEPFTDFQNITTNNLKNINFRFPHNEISAVCGVSGSGKSSLIFDTVYAECKRRQLDGMSGYIRQFIGKEGNPEFEKASGLMPAIALKKKTAGHNPRSIVGTYTGLYDYYRLLFSRIATDENGTSNLLSTAFSFNHEDGACPECKGLGFVTVADPDKFVTYPEKSLYDGAMSGTRTGKFYSSPDDRYLAILSKVGESKFIEFDKPWSQLDENAKHIAMYGCVDEEFDVKWNYKRGNVEGIHEMSTKWIGFVAWINDEYQRKHADKRGEAMLSIMKNQECDSCHSHRIKPENLKYKIHNKNIGELSALSSIEALKWFNENKFSLAAEKVIFDILKILQSLIKSGIGYLAANRITSTLSGGEFQRLQLAGLLKSPLTGVLYVLDEPSFGLSKDDTAKIAEIIKELKQNGNTVLLNDHSNEILKISDTVTVLGPNAGANGGEIIFSGDTSDYLQNFDSQTAEKYIKPSNENLVLSVSGAHANNLQNIDTAFFAQELNVITGNSGSGKTSLLQYVIKESLEYKKPIFCKNFELDKSIESFVFTGQEIITASSLSIPATRLQIFDFIRQIFAKQAMSKDLGLKASEFSFNSKSGQCPDCKGTGVSKTSMDYWSDSVVVCETCNGKRYKDSVLQVKINNLSIADVLELSFSEFYLWLNSLENIAIPPKIKAILDLCEETGISYLSLGQQLNTISTGELQRLKLVEGLSTIKTPCLILLDEPTGGLHPTDTIKLISLFNKLLEQGNTIVCATHDEMLIEAGSRIVSL